MHSEYGNILTMSRPPCPPKHPPMAVINRAAQFAPFSALSGLESALENTGKAFLPTPSSPKDMWDCFQEQGLMYFLDMESSFGE